MIQDVVDRWSRREKGRKEPRGKKGQPAKPPKVRVIYSKEA